MSKRDWHSGQQWKDAVWASGEMLSSLQKEGKRRRWVKMNTYRFADGKLRAFLPDDLHFLSKHEGRSPTKSVWERRRWGRYEQKGNY